MDTQPKPSSRLLAAVHETAAGMHRLGVIDSNHMQSFNAMYLTPEQASKLAILRGAIHAGTTSGPGVDAEDVFARLAHKYGL